MTTPDKKTVNEELKQNPLVNYLKVFQNQHKVISFLYKGLIISFLGFVFLLSFLIFTILDSQLIPFWGKASLAIVDILLMAGVIKAFYELGKYKRKSMSVLNQIYTYLKTDLEKFEKIKSEHEVIKQSHKKLQNKMIPYSSKSKAPAVEEYQGWDARVCPKCHATIEMLAEVCPQCHYSLGKIYTN